MQPKTIFLFLLISFFTLSIYAQDSSSKFKVVGYYAPLSAAADADLEKVPFEQLTHLNLAFLNPDSAGNFHQDLNGLAPFIKEAHNNNVKVLFSIGGGGEHPQYHALLKDNKRDMIIDKFVSLVQEHNIDGIDVDLEWGDIDENYETFVIELREALKAHEKLITAALPIDPPENVTKKALAQYDFINVMAYDKTGPWSPKRHGHHSPYYYAMDALDYYRNQRNIAGEKLTLGVPFYGRGFGADLESNVISMLYKEIVADYPGAAWVDHWHLPGGRIIYYNGISTIKDKTELAKEKASGIMIWQINQDTSGNKSLLNAINEAAY